MPETRSSKRSTGALRSTLIGVGVQIATIVVRWLIARQVRDATVAGRALMVVELLADGVTVALFAMATFGGIMQLGEQI